MYLEDEGVPTVQVSLVREHTAAIAPPRALWVPFILGRPLGVPGDAAFQQRVVTAALRLLEREEGPVLEDYPEEATEVPVSADQPEALACPIGAPATAPAATLPERVAAEIESLRMWHDLSVRRRGRTALGTAKADLETLVTFIGAYVDGRTAPSYAPDLKPADALRVACEEIKAYYYEARMGQPGTHGPTALRDWFWGETAAGDLLRALGAALANSDSRGIREFARNALVPRAASALKR